MIWRNIAICCLAASVFAHASGAQQKLDGRPEGAVDLTDDLTIRGSITGTGNLNTGSQNGTSAFDNDQSSPTTDGRFGGNNIPFYCTYTFTTPKVVDKIGIMNQFSGGWAPENRSPKNFYLKAAQSADATEWTTLLSVENEAIWSAGEWRYWSFDNPTAYCCYRLVLGDSHNGDSGYTMIQEAELYEGAGESEYVTIIGSPSNYGVPSPGYGLFTEVEMGTSYTFTCSAAYTNDATGFATSCKGYRLALTNGVEAYGSGTSTSFVFSADTACSTLTWLWGDTRHRLTLSIAGSGDADFLINGVAAVLGDNWVDETNAVVVTAVPKNGSTFVRWNDTQGTSPTRTNELLAAATMTAFVQAADERKFTADDYQRDGLVFLFDGVDNAGKGVHDDSATQWTDLSGNGNHLVNDVDATYVWGWNANGYTNLDYTANNNFTGGKKINTRFLPKVPSVTLDLRNFTFETDANVVDEASRSTSKSTYGSGYLFYLAGVGYSTSEGTALRIEGNNQLQVLGAGTSLSVGLDVNTVSNQPHAVLFSEKKSELYEAGGRGWKSGTSSAGPTGGSSYTGDVYLLNKNGASYYRGEMRTARLYNRRLTQWESEWNCMIDRIRFHGLLPDASVVTHTYGCTPANYGTPDTPYGTTTVADGTVSAYSAAPILTTSDDDAARIATDVLGTGLRAKFLGWTLHCGNVVTTGSTESASVTLTNLMSSFTWDFERQVAITARASAGGLISVDGAAALSEQVAWREENADGTVTLTATAADEDHVFSTWSGDIGTADATAATITVPTDKARTVVAVFLDTKHTPVDLHWNASVTSGNWNDPTCWAEGSVPQTGDSVYLTNDVSSTVAVTIDARTAHLAKLVVSNRLGQACRIVLKNWMTSLTADEIDVGAYGQITTTGGYGTTEMSNRVWIVANTVTVRKNGSINADNGGYKALNGPCWVNGTMSYSCCGIYGAPYGGEVPYGNSATKAVPYGSAKWPYDPGSGSSDSVQGNGPGGGAIFIDASGDVTVDGTVSANSTTRSYGIGSGGGILINCHTILGSGSVSAYGSKTGRQDTSCGGGGRIAVHYDPSAQSNAVCTVTFDVFGGIGCNLGYTEGSVKKSESDIGDLEEGLRVHLPGSLWFPDNQFLFHSEAYKTAGYPFLGTWNSDEPLEEIHWVGDRTLNKTRLFFDRDDFRFTMDGNLTLIGEGSYGRIVYGLIFTTNATVTVNGDLTLRASRLQLTGGKLTVAGAVETAYVNDSKFGGGEIALYALPTNAPNAYGAEAEFKGHVHLSKNSVIAPFSQMHNGAAVRLYAKSLTIDAGGKIDADTKGYSSGRGPGQKTNGSRGYGGAYGGQGGLRTGLSESSRNLPCGDPETPVFPGSGNSYCNGFNARGGGVVLLEVNRAMVLNGTVTADGNRMNYGYYDWYSGSSGGSVYIRARHFTGTGTIRARGGVTQTSGDGYPAAGGGGRVAIWARNWQELESFGENNVDVSAGCAWGTSENGGAEAGTVRIVRLPPPGFVLLVR